MKDLKNENLAHWNNFFLGIVKKYIDFEIGNLEKLSKFSGLRVSKIRYNIYDIKNCKIETLLYLVDCVLILKTFTAQIDFEKAVELKFSEKEILKIKTFKGLKND